MTDLFWPGAERRGDQFTQGAFLQCLVNVEAAWLAALVGAGVAPAAASDDLTDLLGPEQVSTIAAEAEATGTPVLAMVGMLRSQLSDRNPDAAQWLHRGLTSQDVVDTAMVMLLREGAYRVRFEIKAQVVRLVALVEAHRDTQMVARTLTQHAVPTTFGLKAATWLDGLLAAGEDGDRLVFPAQFGGAAGTMAATVELAAGSGAADPARTAVGIAEQAALTLGLTPTVPWHTTRGPMTRLGQSAIQCTNIWGTIANDVLTLSRPELGELSEGTPGGSSTMPHKRNPVLAALVRRAALVAPSLGATMNLASTEAVDERAGGAWHAEWSTIATLGRDTVTAASQMTELLAGLEVHADRMAETLASSMPHILTEQRSMAELVGRPNAVEPGQYLGASSLIIDQVLDRARTYLTTHEVVR
jgi:3-carboxy-cis,cis-muconate cycloisomerase